MSAKLGINFDACKFCRFFYAKYPTNLLPLHSLMEMPMTVSKKIKQTISEFPDDFVFAVSDLDCDVSQREAAARALQRMAENGEISKLSNGKYYKPRVTVFGNLKPSPAQVAKEFLVKDGRVIGYLTGATAFSQYSLTTQISSGIQIGTNYYRRPLKRGNYNISFVLQPNDIKEDAIDLFRLLDCLKFIKEIPGTTPNEACKRIICIISGLDDNEKKKMAEYALNYAPSVKALLGAIMEYLECGDNIIEPLRQSLNGISKYRIPITDAVLPNKLKWRIYEPARR
ncbi:DUF6088 family protein [uncultured Bacteroides sp.]|uniref:type IV toxin-antitoxin system AbiEi family antitoxin domain-containing protein n=2 Tax=Bacteroidales TaxID=171549 RepID=UPI002670BD55|nr:DUF6088 family protein [uncultured Bacteroides sp.]